MIASRVTVMVYVLVVAPSCAVTTTLMVFAPKLRLMGPDALPDATVAPFTWIVAFRLLAVGVILMLATLFRLTGIVGERQHFEPEIWARFPLV